MVAGWVLIGGLMAVTEASYFSTSEMLVARRSSISSLLTALVENGVSSSDLRPRAPLLTLSFFFSTVALTTTWDTGPESALGAELEAAASASVALKAAVCSAHRPAATRARCRRVTRKCFVEDGVGNMKYLIRRGRLLGAS